MTTWDYPDELDATVAAPNSHRVLLENDQVRVLEVTLEPGAHEPEHTHRWPSVMITDQPVRIRYFTGPELTYETPDPMPDGPVPRTSWLAPEGPHSVHNLDQTKPMHAFRIEFKQA